MKCAFTLAVAAPVLLAGCTSFNRYGTARTSPEGEGRVTIFVEGGSGGYDEDLDGGRAYVPAAHVRRELVLTDRTELGLEAGLGAMLGADVKQELLRASRFGFAAGARASFNVSGPSFTELQVPLLADVVVFPWLVLVPSVTGGVGFRAIGAADYDYGALAGGGLGVYLRLGDGFAIQPAASATWELDSLYLHRRVGLAFSFGPQPRF